MRAPEFLRPLALVALVVGGIACLHESTGSTKTVNSGIPPRHPHAADDGSRRGAPPLGVASDPTGGVGDAEAAPGAGEAAPVHPTQKSKAMRPPQTTGGNTSGGSSTGGGH